jgi:hypothetical protein
MPLGAECSTKAKPSAPFPDELNMLKAKVTRKLDEDRVVGSDRKADPV